MSKPDTQDSQPEGISDVPPLERFLLAVEEKSSDPNHRRLLQACRKVDPATALEAELRAVVSEIIDEA